MRYLHHIQDVVAVGLLAIVSLTLAFPANSQAVSANLSQKIVPLECILSVTDDPINGPTIVLDESCELPTEPVDPTTPTQPVDPTVPVTPPIVVTVINDGEKRVIQLPFTNSTGYEVVEKLDCFGTITIPFTPPLATRDIVSTETQSEPLPAVVFAVVFFTGTVVVASLMRQRLSR